MQILHENEFKVKRYKNNFKIVEQELKDVEQEIKFEIFNLLFKLIMKTFKLSPCKEIGIIKSHIKESIIEGKIQNNYDDAFNEMLKIAEELGMKMNN